MQVQLLDLHGNILMETALQGVPSPGEWVQFDFGGYIPKWVEEPPERERFREAHARWRVLSVKHVLAFDQHRLVVVLTGDDEG